MLLHGVPSRGIVGYLNRLEALRYFSVGDHLKRPVLPVWVLGSESHFSVIFSTHASVNRESAIVSAMLGQGICVSCVHRRASTTGKTQWTSTGTGSAVVVCWTCLESGALYAVAFRFYVLL